MFCGLVFVKTLVVVLFGEISLAQTGELSNMVTLQNGNKLEGILLKSHYLNNPYVEFRGIPYAKPPTKDNRFMPTVLLDEIWGSAIRDATEYGFVCPQLDPWHNPDPSAGEEWDELKVLGDEDCLFVNVASPNTTPDTLLPVMVWFHGGSFQTEGGHEYGPGKWMDYPVVVVTFNYRLGPLGFLNTNDGSVLGNMGLKDQTILLKWVKQNIRSFGGDPDKVTLMGVNTGAVSIHLHMLSELSRGLFHQVVIQSGTAISPWAFMKNPGATTNKLSKVLKCGNETDAVTCIASADAEKLTRAIPKMAEWFLDPMVPFGPSIELFGDMQDRFLSEDPYSILAEGSYWAKDIPVLMGVNSHEGLLHAMDIGHQPMLRMVFNMEWHGSGPISLYYKNTAVDTRSVSSAVWKYYFPKEEDASEKGRPKLVDKDNKFENLTNLYSDRHFFVPVHHSARLMGKLNELYLYWFDYLPGQSIHGNYGYNSSFIFGPTHYDQLQFLFVTSFFNETTAEDHLEFQKNYLTSMVNFISGSASSKNNWLRITEDMADLKAPFIYNRIGKPGDPAYLEEVFTSRVNFWNDLLIIEYDRLGYVEHVLQQQEKDNSAKKDEL